MLTSAGKAALGSGESGGTTTSGASVSGNTYVIQGTGSGHNVGMSGYGAYAMAQQGKTFRDIPDLLLYRRYHSIRLCLRTG